VSDFDDLEKEFLQEDADIHPSGLIINIDPEERMKRREIMEKRSGQDMQRNWQQGDRMALAQAEALNAPPVISHPNCDVCQSPHRLWIDRQLVKGIAYKAIADSIPEGPSRKSIANHWKVHMALDQAVIRAELEEEANLLGQNLEEGVRGAFTLRGALGVLVRKGYQDAVDGITTVEPRDLIQMIRALNEMNTNAASTAVEEAKTSIGIFLAAIQNVLIKGDIIDRELGIQLVEAIVVEVERLREDQQIETQIERQLLPPGR
jgi:hypothetical protein